MRNLWDKSLSTRALDRFKDSYIVMNAAKGCHHPVIILLINSGYEYSDTVSNTMFKNATLIQIGFDKA